MNEGEQRYKLLSQGERKYVSMTDEEINQSYKRPDLTKAQYDSRIRRRVIGALEEIGFLCEKLPHEKLQKIFTQDNLDDIINILEKALAVVEPTIEAEIIDALASKRQSLDKDFIGLEYNVPEELRDYFKKKLRGLEKYYMFKEEMETRDELLNRYVSYSHINLEILLLKADYGECIIKRDSLLSFISEKKLIEEYKSWEEQKLQSKLKQLGSAKSAVDEMKSDKYGTTL